MPGIPSSRQRRHGVRDGIECGHATSKIHQRAKRRETEIDLQCRRGEHSRIALFFLTLVGTFGPEKLHPADLEHWQEDIASPRPKRTNKDKARPPLAA